MFLTASSDGTFAILDPTTGQSTPMSFLQTLISICIVHGQAPPIEETPEALEAECIALVTSLFQTKTVYPIKLDGREINPIEGASAGIDYFHYVNGHTLSVG